MTEVIDAASGTAEDQRRLKILRAAHEEFAEHGYWAATMSRIAIRLGRSKGTLYNYFSSKKELFEAHIAELYSSVRNTAVELDADEHLSKTLTSVGEDHLQNLYSEESLKLTKIFVVEIRVTNQLRRFFYHFGSERRREDLETYLMSAKARGFLRRDADCGAAADQFLTLCEGPAYLQRLLDLIPTPSRAEIRRHVRDAVLAFTSIYTLTPDSSIDG